MPRTRGYALRGQKCYGKHDWNAKGRTNVIGALLGATLLTVSLFQTTITTDIFTAWLERDLIPKLPPHSVVVMDNATFHKGDRIKQSLEKAGHDLLYLPPYSPDFSPIEKKWAHAKAVKRQTNEPIDTLFLNTKL